MSGLTDPKQLAAFNAATTGRDHMLITGAGGVGKSYIIKQIKAWCDEKDIDCKVTAMTNMCAGDIGGKTPYAEMGFGLLTDKTHMDIERKFARRPHIRERWRYTQKWIIDECSMMSDDDYSKIVLFADAVVRGNGKSKSDTMSKSSGLNKSKTKSSSDSKKRKIAQVDDADTKVESNHIQLILFGDFFQLPPITKRNESRSYLFLTKAWLQTIGDTIFHLTTNFRQIGDPYFQELNQRVRIGEATSEDIRKLEARNNAILDNEKPTLLSSKKVAVKMLNDSELAKLPAPTFQYDAFKGYCKFTKGSSLSATDKLFMAAADKKVKLEGKAKAPTQTPIHGRYELLLGDPDFKSSAKSQEQIANKMNVLIKRVRFEETLELKLNSDVILIENLDPTVGLVNGRRGKIMSFYNPFTGHYIKTPDDASSINQAVAVNIPAVHKEPVAVATPVAVAEISNPFQLSTPANVPKVKEEPTSATSVASTTQVAGATPSPFQFQLSPAVAVAASKSVTVAVAVAPSPFLLSTVVKPMAKKEKVESVICNLQNEDCYLPVVKFVNGIEILIRPFIKDEILDCLEYKKAALDQVKQIKKPRIYYSQLPLLPAYALTIHKVQGMTLDALHADLNELFEDAMFYVILSRVRSLNTISFKGFTKDCIRVDETVAEFYRQLVHPGEKIKTEKVKAEKKTKHITPELDTTAPKTMFQFSGSSASPAPLASALFTTAVAQTTPVAPSTTQHLPSAPTNNTVTKHPFSLA